MKDDTINPIIVLIASFVLVFAFVFIREGYLIDLLQNIVFFIKGILVWILSVIEMGKK
jgi:hypothetical protein